MARGLELNVEVRGALELVRAADRLVERAEPEIRDQARDVAEDLADRIRAAGRASSRQSARAAATMRVEEATFPSVTAGPHPLLFGSEFGAWGRFGWYGLNRYYGSIGRQFRPHTNDGYWFFPTYYANLPWLVDHWEDVVNELLRDWPR